MVAKAQVSISIAMEALAGARREWKHIHAELLHQGAGADAVAGAEVGDSDMVVGLDTSEKEELELFRAARAVAVAGDQEKCRRLVECDLVSLELKRRMVSEHPAAVQPVA